MVDLERFDEVWAEINDLPSPFVERRKELSFLESQQLVDAIQADINAKLREAMKSLIGDIEKQTMRPDTMVMSPEVWNMIQGIETDSEGGNNDK